MLPIAVVVMAALSLGSVFSGTDEPNKQIGDQAAADAIRLMIGSSSMELAVDHGAVTVRHGVLSSATDHLSDGALLQLYRPASRVGWVPFRSHFLAGLNGLTSSGTRTEKDQHPTWSR